VNLQPLLVRAGTSKTRLLLAGGDSPPLRSALDRLRQAGLQTAAVVDSGALRPDSHPRLHAVATVLREGRPERVRDAIHALDLATDPLRFAAGLAALGDADAVVSGPGVTPELGADTATWTRGAPPDGGPVHSATWLLTADGGLIAIADAAFAGDLTPGARARLACLVARAHQIVSGKPAHVAFLAGPLAPATDDGAGAALAALARLQPGLPAEVDRAVRFRGRANVFIFPSGTSAHLAARTGRALGGAALLGPLILGPLGVMATAEPDATDDEVTGTAALAVLLAAPPET
jgi:phosphotransacetylase